MSEATPGPWRISEFDGTTICGPIEVGVAACAPDPLCREHYRGGPFGGHHFSPNASVSEQKANARLIVRAPAMRDFLVDLHRHLNSGASAKAGNHLRVRLTAELEALGLLPP